MTLLVACHAQADKKHHDKKNKTYETKPVSTPAPSSAGCNEKLWRQVYDPSRLTVLNKCIVVTGVIEERNADEDGDEHMLLKLDNGLEYLLTSRNYKKKQGDLVIEVVCVNHISRKSAKGACKGYVNNVWLPSVGDHVRVTGSYVNDSHNGWTEIHPASLIEKIK
jgi:hypothetical protein